MKETGRNVTIILKAVLCCAAVLLIAAALEVALFEWRSVYHPKTEQRYLLSNGEITDSPIEDRDSYLAAGETISEVDDSWINTYEDPVYYCFEFPSEFFNRVEIDLKESTEPEEMHDVPYTVIVHTVSDYGTDKYTYLDDRASWLLGSGVTEIKDVATGIWIVVERGDAERISELQFANRFVFNYERWLLLVAGVAAVVMLTVLRRVLLDRLHLVFLILATTFGLAILFSHGITPLSWDEQIHFSCIYQMSYTGEVPQTESYMAYTMLELPEGNTIEEHEKIASWADAHHDMATAVYTPKDYPYTTVFGRVGYLSEVLGMRISRLFGAGFFGQIYAGNLANLLMYVVVITLAIYLSAFGKRSMFFIAMLPVPLLLATAFSYDPHVNAFLLLGYALYTREYVSPEKLNYKRAIVTVLILAFAVIPKAVYFPLILLPGFLPKEKFRSGKERGIFMGLLFIVALVVASTFVLPTILAGSGGADVYSDPRRATANVSEQLSLVLHHPVKFAKLLFSNVLSWQLPWYLGMKSWTNFVYSGMYTGTGTYLIALIFAFLALTQGTMDAEEISAFRHRQGMNPGPLLSMKRFRIGAIILSLFAECLVWTAMYLAFNPVGAERIKGMQGRYLFPFVWLMLLVFFNKTIECRMKQRTYNTIIVAGGAFITFVTIYMVYWSGLWMNVL